MTTNFTPIFLFLAIAVFTGVSMLALSALLGPSKRTTIKQMPYESGMDPIGDARQRFDVRFYLVAIAFLLFDVELLYLYPWAVAQWSADPALAAAVAAAPGESPVLAGVPPIFRGLVFWEIMVFVAILAAAFAYAWKKGVFEWR
jgi:NADH-quinone oxidoreductase subunit A